MPVATLLTRRDPARVEGIETTPTTCTATRRCPRARRDPARVEGIETTTGGTGTGCAVLTRRDPARVEGIETQPSPASEGVPPSARRDPARVEGIETRQVDDATRRLADDPQRPGPRRGH